MNNFYCVLFALALCLVANGSNVETGNLGKNVRYYLNTETRVLIINGTGLMNNYTEDNRPPFFDKNIKKLTIEEGVENIGSFLMNQFYSNLTSAKLPNSLKVIESSAFASCYALSSLSLGKNVQFIGEYAFYRCNVTSLTIPDSVKVIGKYAFSYCPSLTSVTLPNGLTSIGESAFQNDVGLRSIVIPDSVNFIQSFAFQGCSSLESVTLPNNPAYVLYNAFRDCTSLKTLFIPDRFEIVDGSAFYGCSNLISFVVSDHHPLFTAVDGILFDTSHKTLVAYPPGKKSSQYTVDESVRTIGSTAFYGNIMLTSVSLPGNLVSIKDSAFCGCSNLTSMIIPDTVTELERSIFVGCSSLSSITLSSRIKTIPSSLFYGCSSLMSIEIPKSVSTMEDSAFYGCKSLKTIQIPDTMGSIPYSLFRECSSLASIQIPDSVVSIDNSAFLGCSSLKSVIIPPAVSVIGNQAFCDCSSLESVVIPASVKLIDTLAFELSNNLESVTYLGVNPPSFKYSSDQGPFYGCEKLKNVTVPECYKSSLFDKFNVIKSLPCFLCGPNVVYNFSEGSGLLSISGEKDMYEFNSSYPAPWSEYRSSVKEVVIGKGVTSVGTNSFDGCDGMKTAVIGESVSKIGFNAFNNCRALENVTYYGIKSPSHSGNVFGSSIKLQCVNVKYYYSGDKFCEKPICHDSSSTSVAYSFAPSAVASIILWVISLRLILHI